MKFVKVLDEKRVPITGATRTGKKYNMYRGLTYLVLGEAEPPDVHGIPKQMEAYGRGWVQNGRIQIDGGPQGSRQGHPTTAENGFYWAADYDAVWTGQDGKKRKGIMYIRGRAGTSEDWLEKNIITILEMVFKRLPK
jgi:hypothetical protein